MLRHYGYAVSGQLAQTAISLAGLGAITRILGPGDYGTFVVLGTILTLLTVAASAGPSAAVLILAARNAEGRPWADRRCLADLDGHHRRCDALSCL
jgi:O-antigen/teichoic acid export membrane protein